MDIHSLSAPEKIISISINDPNFPQRLREIGDDCPDVIYCRGNVSLLGRNDMVAIIGARNADHTGIELAHELGVRFSTNVVVSGLARGIDTAAHWGCVDAEQPTIAVVGTGLDKVHPKENAVLQERILETGGLIVSEQASGTKASPRTLVARTRLQMALANKVIVVECEKESGTMHAVDYAIRYNKLIYAIDNAWSGNQYLLKNNFAKALPPESTVKKQETIDES